MRDANAEAQGKVQLYKLIFLTHPYAYHTVGRVSSLVLLTLDDVKGLYRDLFNRLIVVKVPSPESAASPQEREARVRALAEYREAYRLFLISAHGFEAAVVERLAGSQAFEQAKASGYADEGTPSTLLILKDLERMYGPASAVGLPAMAGLPEVRSLAEFAGMEYVRRGSRAGGAVIGAVVTHNLGLDRESGASFLQQYGRDTKRVLVAFKAEVRRNGDPLMERVVRTIEVNVPLDSSLFTKPS